LLVERGADPKGFALEDLEGRLAKLRPSVVILEQWALAAHLGAFSKPVVIDLHGSLLLENVYRRGDVDLALDAGTKLRALARADLLLVPSVAQLSWFASWAALAGFDPREAPLKLLPLALPGTPIRRETKKPKLRLVYGGAKWPWIDSRDALLAAAEAVAPIAGATLDVFAYEPPRHGLDYDEELGTWDEVEQALQGREADGITLHGSTSHADFMTFLRTQATVALDHWAPNPERLLAATTRSVESLHAGLPVITAPEAAWAPALLAAGAGWTTDAAGLAGLLRSLAKDGAAIARASAAATDLATAQHTIEPAGATLAEWLESPMRAVRGTPLLDQLVTIEKAHNALAIDALEADHRLLIDRHVAADQVEQEDLKARAAADIETLSARHAATVTQITEGHRVETAKILTTSQRRAREAVEHWAGELDRLRDSKDTELKSQAARRSEELEAQTKRHAGALREALGRERDERAAEREQHTAELQGRSKQSAADLREAMNHERGERAAFQERHAVELEAQAKLNAAELREALDHEREDRDDERKRQASELQAQTERHEEALDHERAERSGDRDRHAVELEAQAKLNAAELREVLDHERAERDEERERHAVELQAQAKLHAAELREALDHERAERSEERERLEGRIEAHVTKQTAELEAQALRHTKELREALDHQGIERAAERERYAAEIEVEAARLDLLREQHLAEREVRQAQLDQEHEQQREDIESLVAAHRAQMETAKTARETEVQQIVGQWQAELAQADLQRTAEMETADERHRGEIAEAVADWQTKLEAAHDRLRAAKAKHQEETARLEVELNAERARVAAPPPEPVPVPVPEPIEVDEAPPPRRRGTSLPGRSGQALRLARLWVANALDRDG
jgi:hypothetical protein